MYLPDHELKLCGQDSVHAHTQLSRVYFASTMHVTQVIKCTRLSPTLDRRAWERGVISKLYKSVSYIPSIGAGGVPHPRELEVINSAVTDRAYR